MNRLGVLLASLAVAATISLHAQTILLPERWRFALGDSSVYSDPSFVDTSWALINVPSPWEDEGYPGYDGFAWYRTSFAVDEALLDKRFYLFIGKIDDADEVFLNGTRIGATGGFPPKATTAWDRQRIYPVPAGLLRQKNIIAVRVYDMMIAGGIVAGTIGLYDEKDYEWTVHPPPGPRAAMNGRLAVCLRGWT